MQIQQEEQHMKFGSSWYHGCRNHEGRQERYEFARLNGICHQIWLQRMADDEIILPQN